MQRKNDTFTMSSLEKQKKNEGKKTRDRHHENPIFKPL